ncbi:aldolase-type tim barrel [Lucifera butyrica]|uniref:Aldolase-type tim barrel n=1 Tax=Lucifera butyrica TaxID=1351585 RepID=A0A498RD51_9FIRM|nr:class II D-tagatose-bisphosphate aldolase, non-catalytic subunit [Lucifera butyrica]VBB09381.1 aldolase-type tim barrel [Lucifera butyrica]
MQDSHPLKNILEKRRNGIPYGLYAVCSANEYVIAAAMERAAATRGPVLIEATANQVNQFGGYTGMKPVDFRDFVYRIADNVPFPRQRILLGGDHLGPLPWQEEPVDRAMEKARELVRQYVLAGFSKIHLDTSMPLAGDCRQSRSDPERAASRGAELCREAELASARLRAENPAALRPVYVVGSEVPAPGGSREGEAGLAITRPEDLAATVAAYGQAFRQAGLEVAWENVAACVVQPGVEFGEEAVHAYDRAAARELTRTLQQYPGLVLEGHSTDYQTPQALKEMVEDGIAILKVGPALSFALREGLFALSYMEKELLRFRPDREASCFMEVLDWSMARTPAGWTRHYTGSPPAVRYARKYSLFDRCRYYLPLAEVRYALSQLLENLRQTGLPLTLLRQFMPRQYDKVRGGRLENEPVSLVKDWIGTTLDDYLYAVRPVRIDG